MNSPTIKILYEDESIVAVDKPEGLSSIRERGKAESLHEILERQTGEKLFIVHRLDKAVSGVMLFAKNAEAHRVVNAIFLSRALTKRYTAVVVGIPVPAAGRIDAPLKVFGSGRTGVHPEGKPSVTEYAVTETLQNHALVDVKILTGRRHQIRAHFYSVGNPVAGDLRYGDRNLQSHYPRMLLHSSEIAIPDWRGSALSVSSPLPPSFVAGINWIRDSAQ